MQQKVIFKIAYKKGNKHLLKVDLGNDNEKWADVGANVYSYAKKTFTEGEEITIEYEEKNGQYTISRVNSVTTNSSPTSEDKTEEKKTVSKSSYKSNFDSELSKRQTCMNSTATILTALVGQLDPNNVIGVMETIYNKAFELIDRK